MRDITVLEAHKTRVRTLDWQRGDRAAPLDCCYKNKFHDYRDTDCIIVGLEMDPKNLAALCEELVDGCKMVKNNPYPNAEFQNLVAFGTLKNMFAGLQTIPLLGGNPRSVLVS